MSGNNFSTEDQGHATRDPSLVLGSRGRLIVKTSSTLFVDLQRVCPFSSAALNFKTDQTSMQAAILAPLSTRRK